MRLMIDTNIFLDVLLRREPFYSDSSSVLRFCEENKAEGCVTASSITDLYYLFHRYLHSSDLAYHALGSVLKIVKILPVTNDDVLDAFHRQTKDFEDGLMSVCAKRNRCDVIVTRDKEGFNDTEMPYMTPAEILGIMTAK